MTDHSNVDIMTGWKHRVAHAMTPWLWTNPNYRKWVFAARCCLVILFVGAVWALFRGDYFDAASNIIIGVIIGHGARNAAAERTKLVAAA